MRKAMLALGAFALTAPVMVPVAPAEAQSRYKTYRGDNGRYYCKRRGGTTGAVVGGVGGALVGRAIDGRGITGTLLGAGAGALAGREIERSRSTRRCYRG